MLKFNKNALSLVALLVVLTTISVAMALLIPVMTKKQTKIDENTLSKKNGGYYICYRLGDQLYEYRADIINGAFSDKTPLQKVESCKFHSPADVQEFKVTLIGGGGRGADSKISGEPVTLASKKLVIGENKTILKDPLASYGYDWTRTAFSAFLRNVKLYYKVEGGEGASSDTWVDKDSGETRYATGEKGGICQISVSSPPIDSVYEYQSGAGAAYKPCALGGADGYFKGTNTTTTTIYAYGGKSAKCSSISGQAINAYVGDVSYGRGTCSNSTYNIARTGNYNCGAMSCGNYVLKGASGAQAPKTAGVAGNAPGTRICHGTNCFNGPIDIGFYLRNFVLTFYDAMGGEAGEVITRTIPFLKDFTAGVSHIGRGGNEVDSIRTGKGLDTYLQLESRLGTEYDIIAHGGEPGKQVENSKKNIDDLNATSINIIPASSHPGHDGAQTSLSIADKAGTFAQGTGNNCKETAMNGASATFPGSGGGGACVKYASVANAGYMVTLSPFASLGYDKSGNTITSEPALTPSIGTGGAGAGGAVIVEW